MREGIKEAPGHCVLLTIRKMHEREDFRSDQSNREAGRSVEKGSPMWSAWKSDIRMRCGPTADDHSE